MITFTDALASITEDQAPLTIPVGVTKDDILKALDLAKAPHILYAGATGSGKSVGLNAGIATLMSRNDPKALRFTMIDPKRVELADYRRSAFVDRVITDMDEAAEALDQVVGLMESRYRKFEDAGVKNIASYNDKHTEQMAYHVLVVDELADLMDTHADTVFPNLVRLGQLARAAGIHMMLATQRPAADTTPKKLVSNIPTRIGFMTQSATESRIILGSKGAEDLKGNGELIAQLPGTKGLVKAQGPFISEDDIAEIVGRNERTDVAPEVAPETIEAAESKLETAAPVAESAPVAPAAPQSDVATIVAQVVGTLTEQLEASSRAKVEAIEAERDEAKAKRDELADEVSALQIRLATLEAEKVKAIDAERTKARQALAAERAADEARIAAHGARADRAEAKMRTAQGIGRKFTPFIIIAGALAALIVAGLISAGMAGLAIAAPLAVAVVTALALSDVNTEESPIKENRHGQHLRFGSTEPGGRDSGGYASASRPTPRRTR